MGGVEVGVGGWKEGIRWENRNNGEEGKGQMEVKAHKREAVCVKTKLQGVCRVRTKVCAAGNVKAVWQGVCFVCGHEMQEGWEGNR